MQKQKLDPRRTDKKQEKNQENSRQKNEMGGKRKKKNRQKTNLKTWETCKRPQNVNKYQDTLRKATLPHSQTLKHTRCTHLRSSTANSPNEAPEPLQDVRLTVASQTPEQPQTSPGCSVILQNRLQNTVKQEQRSTRRPTPLAPLSQTGSAGLPSENDIPASYPQSSRWLNSPQ